MMRRSALAAKLAAALLAGVWTERALRQRALAALGPRARIRAARLVADVLANHAEPYPPTPKRLQALLRKSAAFDTLSDDMAGRIMALRTKPAKPRFAPIPALSGANTPPIATAGDLARWLEIPLHHLDWFADARRTLARGDDTLQHYTHALVAKRAGGWRLLEAPKPRLKEIQRRILHGILDRVPVHESAFGFVAGRNCAMAAAKHAGEDVVVSADLRDYFLSVPHRRVHALFRCLGYPLQVARLLTGLCSTSTPRIVLDAAAGLDAQARQRFATPHLPQGAPTSPALANLCSNALDRRLAGLARRFEARYTRYADDLTFSGGSDFERALPRFLAALAAIAHDEGLPLNAAKTRIMPRHARQIVTGIVVNDHINLARDDFDRLKATLTNCARHGPASQNRDAHPDFRGHLDGRIAWVERLNLRRGEKLRRLFDAIAW